MQIIDRLIEWYHKKRTDKVLQDFGDVTVERALFEDRKHDITVRHPAIPAIAGGVAKFFKEEGGTNFVELTFATPEGVFVMTVSPRAPGVKTPGQVVGELKAASNDLLIAIQDFSIGDCGMAELLQYADDLQELV